MSKTKIDQYIKKYCEKHHISEQKAKTHKMVDEYIKFQKESEKYDKRFCDKIS